MSMNSQALKNAYSSILAKQASQLQPDPTIDTLQRLQNISDIRDQQQNPQNIFVTSSQQVPQQIPQQNTQQYTAPTKIQPPNPIQQQQIPIDHEDFKGILKQYLGSNDPGVQQQGLELYNAWVNQQMKNQSQMQQNQQQLGLNEQFAGYNNQLQQNLENYKDQLAQHNQQRQAAIQASLPDPNYQKSRIQEGSQEVQAAKQGAQQATDTLQKLNRLDQIQDKIGDPTWIQRNIVSHIPGSALSKEYQEFQSLANGLLFAAKPKGINRMTDQDFRMLQMTLPNVGFNSETNRNIISLLRENAQDEQQYAKFLEGYRAQHGGITTGAQSIYDQFKNEVPVFSSDGKVNENRPSFEEWIAEQSNPKEPQQTPTQQNSPSVSQQDQISSQILGMK